MSKLGMVVAAATGYVLGTRAGRQRYEQIQQQAQRLWTDPRVQKKKAQAREVTQQKKAQAQELAREKGAQIRDKVTDATSSDPGRDAEATGQRASESPSATGSGPPPVPRLSDPPSSPAVGQGGAAGTVPGSPNARTGQGGRDD